MTSPTESHVAIESARVLRGWVSILITRFEFRVQGLKL